MNQNNNIELPLREYSNKDTRLYSDLHLIHEDLIIALDAVDRSFEIFKLEENNKNAVLLNHLCTSALNRYYRCFGGGRRTPLKCEEVFDDIECRKAHDYFFEFRSKHVAHSINPLEQSKVGIILSNTDPNEATVLGIVSVSMQWTFYSWNENLQWLKRLIIECGKYITKEMEVLSQRIQNAVNNEEDIKALCRKPQLAHTAPNASKVKKGREYKE